MKGMVLGASSVSSRLAQFAFYAVLALRRFFIAYLIARENDLRDGGTWTRHAPTILCITRFVNGMTGNPLVYTQSPAPSTRKCS